MIPLRSVLNTDNYNWLIYQSDTPDYVLDKCKFRLIRLGGPTVNLVCGVWSILSLHAFLNIETVTVRAQYFIRLGPYYGSRKTEELV